MHVDATNTEYWRGTVDTRLDAIAKSIDDNTAAIQQQSDKLDSINGSFRFARGAVYVIFPILVFMSALLITHLTRSTDREPTSTHEVITNKTLEKVVP